MADIINIAEIAFYRKIGMPVKEMGNFSHFHLDDYSKILESEKNAIEEKLRTYTMMHHLIQVKSEHIKTIKQLNDVEYLYDKVPFHHIVKFSYSDREKLIRYTQNPSCYVRCLDSDDLEHDIRGIVTEQIELQDTVIWQKKDDTNYAVFLIEEIPSENYINNIPDKLKIIRQKHKTGILLANFLLSETIGRKRIDYLKAYVELKDNL